MVWVTAQPSLTSPMRYRSGTTTSSKKSSQNSPVSSTRLIWRMVTPGRSVGNTNQVRPRCLGTSQSVRARQNPQLARCAWVDQIFCPVSTQVSPSFTARVRTPPRSDPPDGSEKNLQVSISPRSTCGTNQRKNSGCPCTSMVGTLQLKVPLYRVYEG